MLDPNVGGVYKPTVGWDDYAQPPMGPGGRGPSAPSYYQVYYQLLFSGPILARAPVRRWACWVRREFCNNIVNASGLVLHTLLVGGQRACAGQTHPWFSWPWFSWPTSYWFGRVGVGRVGIGLSGLGRVEPISP